MRKLRKLSFFLLHTKNIDRPNGLYSMIKKVLITGGSGMIGSALSDKLTAEGIEVNHLSRYKSKISKYPIYTWNISEGLIEEGAFDNVDCIVHLAGAGVADKRWTDHRKKVLTSSRIDTANLLFETLKKTENQVKSFISASAIGIYGFDTGSIVQTEDRKQLGDDFLATLTKKWEDAADQFKNLNLRVVKLRIGPVLSTQGGLLERLVPIAKFGLASPIGSGDQYMSWIHMKDLTDIFMRAITDQKLSGAYNAVAPNPLTNEALMKTLAEVLNRPFILPNVPKFALKMIYGELAATITGGNRVSSVKIEKSGFQFRFHELRQALEDLFPN